MRDHTKLRAFQLADEVALSTYKITAKFPREEQFGLTSQMRRAAVSVPSNTVEGCGRGSIADYVCFLDIAFETLRELEYQVSLAARLGFAIGEPSIAAIWPQDCCRSEELLEVAIGCRIQTAEPEVTCPKDRVVKRVLGT